MALSSRHACRTRAHATRTGERTCKREKHGDARLLALLVRFLVALAPPQAEGVDLIDKDQRWLFVRLRAHMT
jgi:hypothetical protein